MRFTRQQRVRDDYLKHWLQYVIYQQIPNYKHTRTKLKIEASKNKQAPNILFQKKSKI